MKFLPLIWSNLKYKKLRTALTLLSVLVAFILFGFLYTLQEALGGGVSVAGADRMIVRHKVSFIQTLPQSYGAKIASVEGVEAVTHQTWFGGIYKDPKNFIGTFPIEPDTFFGLYPEYAVSPEHMAAFKKTRQGALVGKSTMEREWPGEKGSKHTWKIGDRVPFTAPIWGEPANEAAWVFEIVGTYEATKKGADQSSLFFRYDFFEEARQRGKGEVGWYIVRVKDPGQADAVAKRIDELFANSPHETKTETEGSMAKGFAEQIGDIGTIIMGVLSAVFFTILLVAGNTMDQAVRERTVELGVLKAVGFPNGLVLALVLAESLFIAVLGGVLGLAVVLAITSAGNPVPQMLPFFDLPHRALWHGGILMVALGLVAGLLPSLYAMRLRISEALRRNG